MKAIAIQLKTLIDEYFPQLKTIPENKVIFKPSPSKWSRKEMLGHLIDSAQSNIRRFIVAQYEEEPYIVYNQDKWVALTNYQQYNLPDLIQLWYLLNKHICHILENMNSDMSARKASTGNLHSIEWLAHDYIKHLRHHMHQVLELEPFAYP
jgi:DinB superfamily